MAPDPSIGRLGRCSAAGPRQDAERIERDYGFADWEAPDAGENAKAEHFGGGNAGEGEGWDEVYTRQAERWLGRAQLPEPFCLSSRWSTPTTCSAIRPPTSAGGYSRR